MANIAHEKLPTLHKAVAHNNLYELVKHLPLTMDVNKRDENGNTALILACRLDRNKILERLLNHNGIDVSKADSDGFSALHWLAVRGNLFGIRKILERFPYAEVDAESADRNTPLILAAELNHVDIVEYLCIKGANVNHRNERHYTALHYTAFEGHYEATKMLLRLGANINARNKFDQTPLWKASQGRHPDICRILVQNGAQVDAVNNTHTTSLFYAVVRGYLAVARVLLENGADPNHKGFLLEECNIRKPLERACHLNNVELAELLISFGADINYPGSYSLALHACVRNGSLKCAKLLVNRGVNITGKNVKGETALNLATINGHDDIAALLTDYID